MPIYEYACKICEHKLDALQKMSDDPLVDCPECGEPELKRLLSAPRFRLKGQGWYETDFKKDNQRNLSKGESDKPADKDSKKSGGDAKDSGASDNSKKSDSSGSKDAKPAKKSDD